MLVGRQRGEASYAKKLLAGCVGLWPTFDIGRRGLRVLGGPCRRLRVVPMNLLIGLSSWVRPFDLRYELISEIPVRLLKKKKLVYETTECTWL